MLDHLEGSPDLTPLPEAEQVILLKALSKDPNQRYSCCREFVSALAQAASGADSAAHLTSRTTHSQGPVLTGRERLLSQPSRHVPLRRLWIAALACLGIAVVACAAIMVRDRDAEEPRANPILTLLWGHPYLALAVAFAPVAALITAAALRRWRSRVVCSECGIALPHHQVTGRLKRGYDSIRCNVCNSHIRLLERPSTTVRRAVPAPETRLAQDSTKEVLEFDVFLAHNAQDKPEVEAVAEALRRQGLKPWLDVEQIPPGTFFQDVIQQGIAKSRSAAVFLGLEGIGRFQGMELRAIISTFLDTGRPVIPVLLPGVTGLPQGFLFLRELHCVRFAKRTDEAKAIDQLVWGITGKREIQKTGQTELFARE